MLQNGCLILRLEESRASLEDVFIELTSQQPETPAASVPADEETLEVDADAIINGTVGSAYDAYEPFDAPKDVPDADDEPEQVEESSESETTEEPEEAVVTEESDEPEEIEEPDEPVEEQTEGGEDDAGNV